jgi:putative (di)nucleoside polyphosphate hydrolase
MKGAADERAYRRCAAAVLFAADGRVLVGERIDLATPAWQLPQGGIDDGESARAAALRELAEEIGTEKAAFIGESAGWHRYDLPEGARAGWAKAGFRGQRVKLVAMRFTGRDEDIDVATAHPEFRSWKWVALDALPALAVAFKRPMYEAAVREFSGLRDEIAAAARRR